jgi:ATP/maltotriose-dependent transcriptional regulator MalT
VLTWLAELYFFGLEDTTTARTLIDDGLLLARKLNNKLQLASSLAISGEIALVQDDLGTARLQAEELLALAREFDLSVFRAWSLSLLARVEVRRGNYDTARGLYEELLPIYLEASTTGNQIAILEEFAELLAAQGELVWAARIWGAAAARRTSLGIPMPTVMRAGYERAITAARSRLGEQVFDRAWAEGETMTFEQVLAAPGRREKSSSPSTIPAKLSPIYPTGLTAREVEVLRLVAQGMTDARVAEQLVISPRTVNTHLTSIYNKLGVDSRAGATRFAVEHHLL